MPGARDLPAGVITFLFTDIEGSTRLLRALGDRYSTVLHRHRDVLRAVWTAHHGEVMGTEGDSFLVVFADAADALAAAIDAQRELTGVQWPDDAQVRVRMGVHTGYAKPRNGDYAALVVHQAARIVSAAHGGQILLSGEAAARAGAVPAGVRLQRLGRFRVRDFDGPTELLRVVAPGMPKVAAPPRVRPEDGHNLVRASTTLVGRDEDLEHLATLTRPGLVTTLVGPGGVGKSRLAVEMALRTAGRWADGVWLVELAPVSEPQLVAEAVARAVGATTVPGIDAWAEVCTHLRDREALVILDNSEHLTQAVALHASRLIEQCPEVAVLATGRVPLGLRGEQVQRLEPLPARGPDAAAARLFLDRATTAAASEPDAVADLCAELDGLPLAIELAAARTTALRPSEILERLRRSPSVLRSRDPALPERQRSLERLLDWSYDLLSDDERTALCRLSVFADGFGGEFAEIACAGGDLPADEVPELVWSLVDASLITRDAAAGATRYRLPATVRAHIEQRAGPGERAAAVARLSDAYLARMGPSQVTAPEWIGAIGVELNNVREMVLRCSDEATAQALAWSIAVYHDLTDTFRVGIDEAARSAARLQARGPCRVGLLTRLADLHMRIGELDRAAALAEEAAALAHDVGLPDWDDAGLVRTQADLAQRRGDPAAAAAAAERALEQPHSLRGEARLLDILGIALASQGDPRGAAVMFERELAVAREADMPTFLATTHSNLAEAHLMLGEEALAAEHQAACLELAREQGSPVLAAFSMMIAARLVAARGEPARAVVLQAAADVVLQSADFVLYDEDAEVRDELMAAARSELGDETFNRAVADGHALDPDEARDRAADVLHAVQAESADQEAV